ncbi:AAA family ATPase [Acetivibrio clariflavus]|uniref:AAA+ family ATPase n=1 Tax=Acetivibrio clariflavus (strain DSM 19732 / NBRC 101661 / EBR45) TaxID=720554 RepID=G8LVN1_ACECE|nr:AAA family ATPase [Acetivibrio clariflavus]AEV69667.1 AAA+ family ATPase [Acetivibrio clariflavus DSM 19732]
MDKIELINKMIKANPKDANAWYLLGLEHSQNNNISEALKAFSEALKYCDDSIKNEIITALSSLSESSCLNKDSMPVDDGENSIYLNNFDSIENGENNKDNQTSGELDFEENEDESKLIPLRVIEGKRRGNVPLDEDTDKSVTFSDVGGLDELKETIRMKIIKPFSSPGLFEKFKKKSGGGILLYGPPGCGKTFIAKATAGECKANFIPVHITDILDPYFGVSSQNIRDIFIKARAKKPCVLFFDEIDTIGFNRAKLSSENMRPIIDQFLVELEGIDSSNEKILIIGATNMPWDVDPALRRPGRFDKLIFVMPPDVYARKEIFALKLKGRPIEDIDYMTLAKRTELYSGADIENVVEHAVENVIGSIMKTGIERKINMDDLIFAIEKTKPSTLDWLRTMETYIKYGSNSGMFRDVEMFLKKYRAYLDR